MSVSPFNMINERILDYFFHHLFLPPKLPDGDDTSSANESIMINFVLETLSEFLQGTDLSCHMAIKTAISTMENMLAGRDDKGCLNESSLGGVLRDILSPNTAASFHIKAQNAGILLRCDGNSVIFELFELSPTNGQVYATKGRLVRKFPAIAVGVQLVTYAEDSFQQVLSKTLVRMSYEAVEESIPKAMKAKQNHDEERETNDPYIVTELLGSFLRGMGHPVAVTGIRKNTREEVIWRQSKTPWRRSPVWLLIRISLHRTFLNSEQLYKSFMIFFFSRVLKAATNIQTASETLTIMSTKVSRRLLKLRYPTVGTWLTRVHESVSTASNLLKKRWQTIRYQTEPSFDLKALSGLEMAEDVRIHLPGLDDFISSISKRDIISKASDFRPNSDIVAFDEEFPSFPSCIDQNSLPFVLAMVESWVAQHLDDWLKNHFHDESVCLDICNLMQSYHNIAKSWYTSRPEGASRMVLVCIELWIAADKVATNNLPLLRDYEHEIPIEVLQALLFGRRVDMERLHRAEAYLKSRQIHARRNYKPSIFVSYGQMESFPVEYVSRSALHLDLLRTIEAWAHRQRQLKREEFQRLQADYTHLMQRYDEEACEKIEWEEDGMTYSQHPAYCFRCALRKEAMALSIQVHEWPLSSNPLEAKATVFELAIPHSFGAWRDATIYVIDDLLRNKPQSDEGSQSLYPLRSYSGLYNFFQSNPGLRVHLLSSAKPHVVTHRRDRVIATSSETDVCVNNGLQFRYFDDHRQRFLDRYTTTIELPKLCTFRLNPPSAHLSKFLIHTHEETAGETPNSVIASQSLCPEHMTLAEYKALGTLRYGYRIQWMSVLTQLAMPDLDFNKFETAIFLIQLSLQAGPNDTATADRCAHKRLSNTEFGRKMLECLQVCVSRIRENWESNNALWIFMFLTARLLSMTTPGLKDQALGLLNECRDISSQWLEKLRSRLHEMKDEDERIQFLQIALRVSLICADSFNVDDETLAAVLSDPKQSAILLEVSINIYNNIGLLRGKQDLLENIMHDRWMFTLHRARCVLVKEVLLNGNSCLDITISRYWPAFRRDINWYLVSSTCNWLETTSGHHKVHFNILNGSLLVNGSPLSRLPREYEAHQDYQKLFGCYVLDVMPSTARGMSFCGCKTFDSYAVHFGMMKEVSQGESEEDFLIHLEDEKVSLPTLDLVPSRLFSQSLPHHFVQDYVHWYNHATSSVEFFPTENQWRKSNDSWTLAQHNGFWKLRRQQRILLVAPNSPSASLLAAIFSPLDSLLNLYILFDMERNIIEIQIPRLRLEFSLKSGDSVIRSRQFRGMQIDADQSMQTLVGFESKLLLQDSQRLENRMALVPEGEVVINRNSSTGHVRATVKYGTAHRVQKYLIDSQLQRLVDNATVQSKLFLAYIHAITSYCIPDPFLNRTGIEEAMSILESASIRHIDHLTEESMEILLSIAALTPSRKFYPEHLKTMQQVVWRSELSFMTQDSRFYKTVNRLLDEVSAMSFLYPSDVSRTNYDPKLKHVDNILVEREVFRNTRYQVSHYGAEDFASVYDVEYKSRDGRLASSRASLANETAFKIFNNVGTITKHFENKPLVNSIYQMLSNKKITGARTIPRLAEMEYGAKWLDDPQTFLSTYWCCLHYAFQTSSTWISKYHIMIWLTTMAYSSKCDINILQALIILSQSTHLSAAPLPKHLSYDLAEGYELQKDTLQNLVRSVGKVFDDTCPEMNLPAIQGESPVATRKRRKTRFKNNKTKAIHLFVDDLFDQWPCAMPTQPQKNSYESYLSLRGAMGAVQAKWRIWHENYQFREYLEEFVYRLSQYKESQECFISGVSIVYRDPATRHRGFISVNDLFSTPPPIITEETPSFDFHTLLQVSASGTQGDKKLHKIIKHLGLQTKFGFERQYLSELVSSLNDLQYFQEVQLDNDRMDMGMRTMAFEDHLKRCKNRVQEIYSALTEAVRPLPILPQTTRQTICDERNMIDHIALVAEFWPRLSPIFFLQQLGRHRWPSLPKQWQKAIVTYGVAITIFQQAQRLVQNLENEVDLLREIQNAGHKSWDPRQYPEWLLLECESGIIIRDVQHQIAEQMIMPEQKENAVMQLNMGEGKSSVIVPIVAAALSNKSQIVRVIVAKPQAKQMHQMLVSKLSGLLDRPIFKMPFSRAIRMDQHRATVVQELAHRCMGEGGVMMVQPEHLLSFQLMGLECQINGNEAVGRHLLETQQIFENSSRDIVDESDENFNVKFELIYTIGLQRHIEHTPDRWVVIQEVLDKFAESCLKLKSLFSESLDIDDRHPERFPRIRILRDEAGLAVLEDLASSICSTGITGLSIARQPEYIKDAVHRYITHPSLTPQEISIVEESTYWQDATVNYILLLRGLFSGGILAFAFGQKRWRVDYGTDSNRETKTRLAVPFRAKDNPTPRSEFSHPDVVILLTCLSYYYSGLKNDELFETLDLLIRSDNADLEYDAWVKTAPQLPRAFRQLTGINIRDRAQCVDCIFPVLRYSKGAIDYFLSRMVFAKELREFPHKLSSSGWDLGKKKTNLTTGFSGTNDSRYVLPLAIKQLDIPAQNHTNALVLEYLLRPENGIKLMSQASAGVTLESESLIEMVSVMGPNTRVILDVGAQIIDLDNLQFAQKWLECCKDKSSVMAVVYFSDNDELTVVDKSGKIEPLQLSPFATQLDQCLIFLDEAHTRGTDLRLPKNYQAAVTLGANLTKDKLVQACMRMRKLGKGQSVIFCIPKEIEQKILTQRTSGFRRSEQITVSDVLCWTISETWLDLRRTVPLWLAQGVRFYEQDALWKERKNCDYSQDSTEWARKFLEDEAQSLELRYRPHAGLESAQLIQRAGPEMKREFESRCEEFGLNNFNSSSLQEEQERELSPETEREQQVEQPPQVEPQPHLYHKDLIHFIEHGEFPTNFTGFKSAFHTLRWTSAAKYFDVSDYPSSIWATEDFSKTVMMNQSLENITDVFQRPVQWILTRSANNIIDHLVIISPWEAHQLLEKIEAYKMVTLHLYAPRSNLGFEPLDGLALYTVPQRREKLILPQSIMVQLNIFAGQLYLSSFQEYVQLCDSLGLAWSIPNEKVILGPDGFIHPGTAGGNLINKSGFKKSPVQFLRVLVTKIRRNCEVIEKTHVGKIFDGILLREINFESDDKVL